MRLQAECAGRLQAESAGSQSRSTTLDNVGWHSKDRIRYHFFLWDLSYWQFLSYRDPECQSVCLSETARAAAALDGSFTARKPAPGRSRSESNAPRGSAAIAVIESRAGPKPNLCRASAAASFPRVFNGNSSGRSRPHKSLDQFIVAKLTLSTARTVLFC
jgi:hypothetical protein